jgi:hypothetical protein
MTNLEKVRALINDMTVGNYTLPDTSLNAFLEMHSDDVFMASAQAMNAMACSYALLAHRKSAGDYSEDLSAIARECREAAKVFGEMAANVPAEAVAEQFYTDFSYREILIGKSLRNESD